ncbi:MAG: hypothetical protein B6245_03270 [Desulfobacteraceae bacterium 4572_88]|nr:MAG: hypothetical protein B6245_03270 [Desulfobacteraceae bacterium 4572_88]
MPVQVRPSAPFFRFFERKGCEINILQPFLFSCLRIFHKKLYLLFSLTLSVSDTFLTTSKDF